MRDSGGRVRAVFSEQDHLDEGEWLLEVLGFVAKSIMQGNYRGLTVDDLVSAGAIAYLSGVERLGIQDRAVVERYRILRQRIRGAMYDEIRRVSHDRASRVHRPPQFVPLKDSDERRFVPSTEDSAIRLIENQEANAFIHEILRLASANERDREWYILWKGWEVKLKEIGEAYGVSESRVSQVCTAIQNQIDELSRLLP